MTRYEVIIEIESDMSRQLVAEVFDQMIDDSGYLFGAGPSPHCSLAVMEINE